MPYTYLIIAVLLFNLVFLIGISIGFFIGCSWSCGGNTVEKIKFGKTSSSASKVNKPQIDETKFVTRIDTDNLEKKYTDIGNTKESKETIESSVNKLKSLKG